MNERRFVLVYQAGIANLFEVECFNMASFGRDARRLFQGSFNVAEYLARGIILGNSDALVFSAYCNKAGDIKDADWETNLPDMPFFANAAPVFHKVLKGF